MMTQKEALQILAILKAAYPNNYNHISPKEAIGIANVWITQFPDIPSQIVMMAVNKAVSTSKFPPSIADVKSKLSDIYWEAYEALAENDRSKYMNPKEEELYRRVFEITKYYKDCKNVEPRLSQLMIDYNCTQSIDRQNRIGLEG